VSTPPPPAGPLLDAARWLGVLPSYVDHAGELRHASPPSMLAVAAAAAGLPGAGEAELVARVDAERRAATRRVVEPVVVLWRPGPAVVALRPPGDTVVHVEVVVDPDDLQRGGERVVVEGVRGSAVDLTPLALPVGRHRLRAWGPGVDPADASAVIVVAPRRLAGIADVLGGGGRPWGVFAPVWSAWRASRPEVHLGALDDVGAWVADAGGALVGTLPLLATFADRPCDPSPYSPVSRRRWNEALVDVRSAPGFAGSDDARRLVAAVAPADPAAPWDPVAHWAALRPVLAVLAEQARTSDPLAAPVEAALAADPELGAYAAFRAETEQRGEPWRRWPPGGDQFSGPPGGTRHGGAARADPAVWRWAWSQWLAGEQLAEVSRRFADRRQALYLDLALGAHPDGFDTWADPELFGWGASVGAPPDAMFGGGQDWGFPPQRPGVARASGHEEWARALRAHLGVCGVLRLDHILGLQRLYWVPDGAPPTEGVYVRQPLEELVAVLAVEAARAGAAVVGEDLGTVDDTVRHAMARHGVAGMYVAQFAVPADRSAEVQWPHAGQLAAVNTHDMPTFCGWMSAADAGHRRRAGLIDDDGVVAVVGERAQEVRSLRRALGVPDPAPAERTPAGTSGGSGPTAGWQELLAALLARLGESEAEAVLVSVDDLVGATEQQNVPGTPWSRPNWVVRLPESLDALAADEWVAATLRRLSAARSGEVPPDSPGSAHGGGW
jgi:4-alpha-glucanotransferase